MAGAVGFEVGVSIATFSASYRARPVTINSGFRQGQAWRRVRDRPMVIATRARDSEWEIDVTGVSSTYHSGAQ